MSDAHWNKVSPQTRCVSKKTDALEFFVMVNFRNTEVLLPNHWLFQHWLSLKVFSLVWNAPFCLLLSFSTWNSWSWSRSHSQYPSCCTKHHNPHDPRVVTLSEGRLNWNRVRVQQSPLIWVDRDSNVKHVRFGPRLTQKSFFEVLWGQAECLILRPMSRTLLQTDSFDLLLVIISFSSRLCSGKDKP